MRRPRSIRDKYFSRRAYRAKRKLLRQNDPAYRRKELDAANERARRKRAMGITKPRRTAAQDREVERMRRLIETRRQAGHAHFAALDERYQSLGWTTEEVRTDDGYAVATIWRDGRRIAVALELSTGLVSVISL